MMLCSWSSGPTSHSEICAAYLAGMNGKTPVGQKFGMKDGTLSGVLRIRSSKAVMLRMRQCDSSSK